VRFENKIFTSIFKNSAGVVVIVNSEVEGFAPCHFIDNLQH
jgi:hypothetical protein